MIEGRRLGKDAPPAGALGHGAMVLEGYYGESRDDEAVKTINRAPDAGMTMVDSADAYGNGHNEGLVGQAIKSRKDAFVATKFGIQFDPRERRTALPTGWGFSLNVNANQVRRAHAVHPTAAVQYEYSLWRREAETELLPTLREPG
jgi:aryl-alcohol dehydrogenase-like predicted oxidoreductase